MVNASTPAGYVEDPNTDFQVENDRLITDSGYILSSTAYVYIQLESRKGICLGGENDMTNLQFFGVNPSSTDCQDVEVYVSGGVLGQTQQGDY